MFSNNEMMMSIVGILALLYFNSKLFAGEVGITGNSILLSVSQNNIFRSLEKYL